MATEINVGTNPDELYALYQYYYMESKRTELDNNMLREELDDLKDSYKDLINKVRKLERQINECY